MNVYVYIYIYIFVAFEFALPYFIPRMELM